MQWLQGWSHQSGGLGFHLTTFTELYLAIDATTKSIFTALCMHGQCLVSLTASLPHTWKHCCILLYLHNTSLCVQSLPCLHAAFVSSVFVMLKLPYLNYSKNLTSQFSTFLRDLLARRNLYTVTSRASGLAAKWFDIVTMHAWIQLAIAPAYVLMYYYGNTASSIRRDLTRRLSFIISVWLFGKPKCFKCYWNMDLLLNFIDPLA